MPAVMQFLTSFLLLFKATIEEYKIQGDKISGIVGWEDDEDKQAFSCTIEKNDILPKAKLFCDFLVEHKLLRGDKVIILESELLSKLINSGWKEKEAIDSVNYLFSFSVNMVDNGEETDFFFIHF